MEWVDGLDLTDLTDRLRKLGKKLPHNLVAYIVGEILKALAYAHDFPYEGTRQTIVHRDISPHNVMLSVAGEVKLMDFGVARLASEETSGLFVKGKLRYMPPEQVRGDSREPTVDLFAVGAILHELLDGKKFRGQLVEQGQLMSAALEGSVPPLACPQEDVPLALAELRIGLLAPLTKDRIPTARAAFRKLSEWSGYRDAKFELEDLVRSVVEAGTAPPSLAATEKPAPNTQQRLTATEVLPDDETRSTTSRSEVQTPAGFDASDASTQRDIQAPRSGEEETGNQRRPASNAALVNHTNDGQIARRRRAAMISVTLALMGMSLAIFGMGAMLGWWTKEGRDTEPVTSGSRMEHQTPVESDTLEVTAPSTKPSPSIQQDPSMQQDPIQQDPPIDTPKGNTPAPSLSPAPGLEEQSASVSDTVEEPPTARADAPVPVTVTAANEYKVWVEIKIGKKIYEVDWKPSGSVKTRIKPGVYKVQYRGFDDPWHDAGKVVIPKGGNVTVKLLPDGQAVVERS
jgi:serine/threonine protein kinase